MFGYDDELQQDLIQVNKVLKQYKKAFELAISN